MCQNGIRSKYVRIIFDYLLLITALGNLRVITLTGLHKYNTMQCNATEYNSG